MCSSSLNVHCLGTDNRYFNAGMEDVSALDRESDELASDSDTEIPDDDPRDATPVGRRRSQDDSAAGYLLPACRDEHERQS
jgi:hypothetical protein